MPDVTDTVVEEITETETPEVIESVEVDETTTPDADGTEAVEPTAEIDPAEVERLRKEYNKAQMEINQLRNKEREKEEALAAAELKNLEAEGKFQELAQKLQEREELRAQEAERQKAEDFRKAIIAEYPEDVQATAEALKIYWDDAPDFPTAEVQLRAKLDLLKGAKPASTPKDDTEIHPNNPSSIDMGPDFDSLPLDEQLRRLEKEVGRAPSR